MSIEGGLGGGGGGVGMPGAYHRGRPLPPPTSSSYSYSYSDIANHHRHSKNNDDIKCQRPFHPNDAAAAAAVGNAHRADVDEAMRPRPKRPLSAFNLFYRYKRRRILHYISKLESSSSNNVVDRDAIIRIVGAVPGLEGAEDGEHGRNDVVEYDAAKGGKGEEEDGMDDGGRKDRMRERIIRSELSGINLLPRDNRDRQHRTDESAMNGTMSFVELGRAMNASWKDCDALARSIFDDLAEEGRGVYQGRLKEYLDWRKGSSASVVGCGEDGTSAIVGGGDDWKEETKKKKGTAGRGKRASATSGTTSRKRSATAASKRRTKEEAKREEEDVVGELGDVNTTRDDDDDVDDRVPKRQLAEAASGARDAHRIHRHPPTGTVDLRTVSVDHSISSSFSSSMSSGMDCQDAGTSAPPIIHHQHHCVRYNQPPPAQGQGGGSEVWYAHPRYNHQRQYHHHPSIVGNGGIGIVDDVELRRRIMDINGQLAFDRLNNRVVELEGEISRRIIVEGQLRTRIDELMMIMSSYGGGGADSGSSGERVAWSAGKGQVRMPPAAHFSPAPPSSSSSSSSADHPPVWQRHGNGNGLWSLVSAMDCVGRTTSALQPAGPIVARADRHRSSEDGSPD